MKSVRPPRALLRRAALVCLTLAGVGSASGQTPSNDEKFGFDTWKDNWGVSTNAGARGITNVCQTTNHVWSGAHQLRLECDLYPDSDRTNGVALVDMQDWCPFAISVPVDLDGRSIAWYEEYNGPADKPYGSDPAHTNRTRFFLRDEYDRGFYSPWYNVPTGFVGRDTTMSVSTSAVPGGEVDAGFDPSRVRYLGMQIQMPSGSTGTFNGPFYLDQIRFYAPPGLFSPPSDQKYSFDADDEGFQADSSDKAVTNFFQTAAGPSNNTGCLALQLHLDATNSDYDAGAVWVDMQNYPPPGVSAPVDLADKRVSVWVYCPGGLRGPNSALNGIQIFCKDTSWRSYYGSWEDITTGYWFSVSMTPASNAAPRYGWKDEGFDPTQIRVLGVKVGTAGGSTNTYEGLMYVDGFHFEALGDTLDTNNLRYGFEPNKQGWTHETYDGITGVVSVAQSTNYALEATHSLRLNVDIQVGGTNRGQGAAKVDMRYYPPPTVRTPFNLDGQEVHAYLYCPTGSESTNPGAVNYARVYVQDGAWSSQYGEPGTMRDARWIKLSLTVTTNDGFQATNVIAMGVDISVVGVYTGALYLDHVDFPAVWPDPLYTNTQHCYDQETNDQARYWKWGTNPEGWNATAWTNVYYAAGEGLEGSYALAADATFVTNGADSDRKGVFEIAYQPALNLSTKDHRKIQARLRFDPPVEGLLSFSASINVFDKITDQWYTKNFDVGDSSWNVLEFDLDNPDDYDAGSPTPMDTSSIGYIVIQVYANVNWTGTVYLDQIVVGGVERGTDYATINTGFVKAEGHKFTLDGSNFYHCGANVEYLFSVSDAVCEELLNLAATCHVQAVRTWAFHEGKPYSFQPERGVWNELAFEHMDRIIAMAGHRGIRLMLGLVDNWAHNGGIFQYMKWVQAEHPESVNTNLDVEGVEFHDQFWTNAWAQQWYKDYVTVLLNRTNSITGRIYKQDPTIFAWEIVNEPRCESDFGGRTIHNWLWTNSDWVASIATNHILGGGEEGGYVNTYEFADTVPWEVYPDNYYHYAVHGIGSSTCDLYGCGRGHGVDFISDHSSVSNYVQWQDGTWSNRGTVYGEWRPGVSNLHFCTSRLYVDQKEYNLWRTNLNSCDQRIEWINDHWHDAHYRIGKPMILEEFGIHAIGWVYNGFYGQLQYPRTPQYSVSDRVGVYNLFYRHIENSGIPGSFFWNFGYSNMWEDPFHRGEQVAPWYAYTDQWAAVAVELSTNHVIEGTNALRLVYDATGASSNKAVYLCPTNEMWVLKVKNDGTNNVPMGINRVKFIWNFYNPTSAVDVALSLRGTDEGWLAECPAQTVTTGWNRITYDLSAGHWAWAGSGWLYNSYLLSITNAGGTGILEDVQEVGLVLYGLPTNGAGDLYVDNVLIKRDDGFVIYANDPVCAVIREHADRMAARNVATNNPLNFAPVANSVTITADAFTATAVNLSAFDADGNPLSYRILERPAHGWVFGTPPTNLVYKSKPGTEEGDSFTYVAHDGMADSSVATVTVVLGSTDTDSDDLPDAWEFTYFPKRVQWWPYDSNPLTNLFTTWDWDGDGQPDYNEWYAGTDPTNEASYLFVRGSNVSQQFQISWPSAEGKQYSLERSTNLVYGFDTVVQSNIAATVPLNTYTDATAVGLGPFLYRVEVE